MAIVSDSRLKAIAAIPLLQKPWSDLTPLQLFAAQSNFENLCWLDSGDSDGWSYFAINPRRGIDCTYLGKLHRALLKSLPVHRTRAAEDPQRPPFCGGWVGFLTYDNPGKSVPHNPAFGINFFELILAYSFSQARWWVGMVSLDGTPPEKLALELAYKVPAFLEQFATSGSTELIRRFETAGNLDLSNFSSQPDRSASPPPVSDSQTDPRQTKSNFTRSTYCSAVRRALDYISAGDIYQVNLAQRFTVPWGCGDVNAALLYRRMRAQSPAAYGAFFGSGLVDGRQAICCISPELFLSVQASHVITRPIKGTRPRSGDAAADAAAARELALSAKEIAELNMIIDVERHDLGRVCEYGSVQVDSPGVIEELPTVFHRVATVSGQLRPRCSPASLLRATFPGGSITGAPKIRAMEIIGELEPDPRGIYCGSIGWLGVNGDMELNIAIRTAIHDTHAGSVHYHAGSGIVADSDPDQEYEETLHKARAFFGATNARLGADAI